MSKETYSIVLQCSRDMEFTIMGNLIWKAVSVSRNLPTDILEDLVCCRTGIAALFNMKPLPGARLRLSFSNVAREGWIRWEWDGIAVYKNWGGRGACRMRTAAIHDTLIRRYLGEVFWVRAVKMKTIQTCE